MDTLTDRAARVLSRHPAPAVPFDELRRLVRDGGMAVSEDALLRALAAGGDRFRIVDPWKGRRSAYRRGRRGRRGRREPPRGPGPFGDPDDGPLGALGARWVVARPDDHLDTADTGVLRRLRLTLGHLGWRLDRSSRQDMARWCRLVCEGIRFRERTRAS